MLNLSLFLVGRLEEEFGEKAGFIFLETFSRGK
jgi:hypothetical protein